MGFKYFDGYSELDQTVMHSILPDWIIADIDNNQLIINAKESSTLGAHYIYTFLIYPI